MENDLLLVVYHGRSPGTELVVIPLCDRGVRRPIRVVVLNLPHVSLTVHLGVINLSLILGRHEDAGLEE